MLLGLALPVAFDGKRDPPSTSVRRRTVRGSLGEQRATPTTVFQVADIEGGAGLRRSW
jgi:hypothetical protein